MKLLGWTRILIVAGRLVAIIASCAAIVACSGNPNDPYPQSERGASILYSAFSQRPKHLDPAQAYASDEYEYISQIYEPPLQYHYLKRPYTLIPATLTGMPLVKYYDRANRQLPDTADDKSVAHTVYELRLRPGIRYAPHPAFARNADGSPTYLSLSRSDLEGKISIRDFPLKGARELVASDYIYQIKRLAHPRVHSPILGHMSDYIVGLKEFSETLQAELKKHSAKSPSVSDEPFLDLESFKLSGVTELDRYTWQIRIKGKYPQFSYWLAMPFFAPLPPEADRFYSQRGMSERNLKLDWYPVGTGPYMLTENDPNSRMVLERNPNFRGEPYPSEGEASDAAAGLLADAGKIGPFIDKIVFTREKESIPYWNKFLQGYYDQSGISNDNFDNAVRISESGDAGLSDEMAARGIRLKTSVATSTYYLAFNWLDAVVGGQGDASQRERAKRLRQAISIAVDFDEFISIFANGRGIPGQGPIPPGLFGFRDGERGANPVVYRADQGKFIRRPIEEARQLLALAGYPGGRDAKSGQPLVLYLDTTAGGPGDKARLDWYRKQFQKIGIQLDIRTSDWNRFQEKVRKGNTQMFFLGWNADYPDPENFLFLLYGPNAAARFDGENKANYQNPAYDRLFEQMKSMRDSPQREAIIHSMVELLREDAPWVWGFHPKDYGLYHAWLGNVKPNQMARNGIKFYKLDTALRERSREAWNRPRLWPLGLIALLILIGVLPAYRLWRRRELRPALASMPGDGT